VERKFTEFLKNLFEKNWRKRTLSFSKLKRYGLHYVNEWLTSSQWKALFIIAQYTFLMLAVLSLVMCIVSEGGFLYSAMRIPLWHNLMLLAEDPELPPRLHPEQGMHWSTVMLYSLALAYLLMAVPKRGYKPIHALCFAVCLSVGMWLFPFEWIYVTLYDIFHNIPAGDYTILMYGIPPVNPLGWIFSTVIGRNFYMALGIVFAHFVTIDNFRLNRFWMWRKIYHFDRKSVLLALSWIGMFAFWVLLPLFTPIPTVKGTSWFPQTIYIWYGFDDRISKTHYSIVHEEWHPNDIVRVVNIITKTLTVVWMCYTFMPKKQEEILNE